MFDVSVVLAVKKSPRPRKGQPRAFCFGLTVAIYSGMPCSFAPPIISTAFWSAFRASRCS